MSDQDVISITIPGMMWLILRKLLGSVLTWMLLSSLLGGLCFLISIWMNDLGQLGHGHGSWFVAGAMLLYWLVGLWVFAIYGAHRGLARAGLALNQHCGLLDRLIEQSFTRLRGHHFSTDTEQPASSWVQQVRTELQQVVATEAGRLSGWRAWLLRRAQTGLQKRLNDSLVGEYGEALRQVLQNGESQWLSLQNKISTELHSSIEGKVLAKFNLQAQIVLLVYGLLGVFWVQCLMSLLAGWAYLRTLF